MARSYSDYVFAQSKRNPCLLNLCKFLANDDVRHDCKIVSLRFRNDQKPSRIDLDLSALEILMNADVHDRECQLIIVEDLNRSIIETLGSSLDIDPLFFASHIHGPKVDITSSKPATAIRLSKLLSQNFVSLQYQRSVDFGSCSSIPRKMSRNSNVPRKVAILPPMKDTYIGLEQQSCSVLLSMTSSKLWIGKTRVLYSISSDSLPGVILVDKPNSDKYTSPEKLMIFPSRSFQGGYEDF